ncbi:histidine kinase [Fibrisoma limi BUZ 3]|uniref:Oxygen sensor histidine kinase NreB n=1 Tax=Fibrisoma limi BUZ 3 TaxID=1185876 RepID=I2GPR5_9BACT|nr:ATP-binding protein [Fibrisoma limi]CCH55893.1 histidine kinase [Fibrisoma limi BUZ 3]
MDINFLPVIATVVFLLLAVFITSFALLFQKRQLQNYKEKQRLKAAYEQEILKAQVEIQNTTLQEIGQELHDNIGQLLSVTTLYLGALEEAVDAGEALELVQTTRQVVDKAINDVRALSKSLDSSFIEEFGLVQTLTHEVARIQKARRFTIELFTTGTPVSLGVQREMVLFRVLQELLNNALKHSQAKRILLSVHYLPTAAEFRVEDDGIGFDYEQVLQQELGQSGAGLRNINRRVELIGGLCTYQTAAGGGTSVLISLPL